MQEIIILILVIAILAIGYLLWQKIQESKDPQEKNDLKEKMILLESILREKFTSLNQEQKELKDRIDGRLRETSDRMHESLKYQTKESLTAIRDVTERLVRLDETNKQVISFTEQLKTLQDMLKNPKQRGILGEYYLETTLKNVLPPGSFQMQYKFSNGTIVDAVVFVKDKIIPVDAKFSLENYNRLVNSKDESEREIWEKELKNDLKKRIDETSKYIMPSENTLEFAFMFLPHEALYYDLLINEVGAVKVNTRDLVQYAFDKKVIIVSPTSFLAYLQTVLQGLRSLQIEETAKEIRKNVDLLANHLQTYNSHHEKLGSALGTAINQYNLSGKEWKKIDKDIYRITGEKIELENNLIEISE